MVQYYCRLVEKAVNLSAHPLRSARRGKKDLQIVGLFRLSALRNGDTTGPAIYVQKTRYAVRAYPINFPPTRKSVWFSNRKFLYLCCLALKEFMHKLVDLSYRKTVYTSMSPTLPCLWFEFCQMGSTWSLSCYPTTSRWGMFMK